MSESAKLNNELDLDSYAFEDQIKNLTKKDFDGHTEFKYLTYKERLLWLSQAVRFSFKFSKKKDKK